MERLGGKKTQKLIGQKVWEPQCGSLKLKAKIPELPLVRCEEQKYEEVWHRCLTNHCQNSLSQTLTDLHPSGQANFIQARPLCALGRFIHSFFSKEYKTSWRNKMRDDGLLVLTFTLCENSNVSTDLRQVSVWNGCVSYTAVINDRFVALRGWICKRLNVGLTPVDILQRTEMGYALKLWKDLCSTNHIYSFLRSSKSWYVHSETPLINLIENRDESSVMKDFCSFPIGEERKR